MMSGSWSPWRVHPPVLISGYPAAGRASGSEGHEGTIPSFGPATPHAARGFNSSGPMADREPVSVARFEPAKQTRCGFTDRLSFDASAFHEQKLAKDEMQHVQRNSASGAQSYE